MSLSYSLKGSSIFERLNEETLEPKRIVFLSVEGTKTEVQYFRYVERFRKDLGISAIVHVEVLRKYDTKSDPESVLELLDEYIQFREDGLFEKELEALELKQFDSVFIKTYLNNPDDIEKRRRNQFEAILRQEHIDLLYLDFLSKYKGIDDVFGIVIDRDCSGRPEAQIQRVIDKCNRKGYHCFITNPCFEFWLLLHVSDVSKEYSDKLDDIGSVRGSAIVSDLLHGKVGQRKAIPLETFKKFYLPNTDVAINRAREFTIGCQKAPTFQGGVMNGFPWLSFQLL